MKKISIDKNMTLRQKIMKFLYPVTMHLGKLAGKNAEVLPSHGSKAVTDFYELHGVLNDGSDINFASLKGKKVLLVNTASNCGYTSQYDDLQKLHEIYSHRLQVIGFPANDFKNQEQGDDSGIEQFCKINFGVSFPLMKKSVVVKSPEQNPVFRWLSDARKNGWNDKAPSWNFSKYLVDEEGNLTNYFGPSISPLSDEIVKNL